MNYWEDPAYKLAKQAANEAHAVARDLADHAYNEARHQADLAYDQTLAAARKMVEDAAEAAKARRVTPSYIGLQDGNNAVVYVCAQRDQRLLSFWLGADADPVEQPTHLGDALQLWQRWQVWRYGKMVKKFTTRRGVKLDAARSLVWAMWPEFKDNDFALVRGE